MNGSRLFGMVRSVQEDQSCSPQRWIVTIVPMVEKPALVGWRYSTCSMGRRMSHSADNRDRAKSR